MKLRLSFGKLFCIMLCGFILAACQGGKSPGVACAGQSPYSSGSSGCQQQPTPNNCPTGQVWRDGRCQTPGISCPIGEHLQNGVCVKDGLACSPGQHQEGDRCVADQLSVEIVSQSSCWNPENGATRLIVQFITRDESGAALDPEVDANQEPTALASQIYVNDRPTDVESLLNRDSELLKSDLAMSLVLDSTYSMLRHEPPAFAPMKAAAVDVLNGIQEAWAANDARFHWELTWFNEVIFRPTTNNRGAGWSINNINDIPQPSPGDFTGLWKAVDYTIGVHEELYANNVAAGGRDQHVMIVFSDGEDNHSYFDNSAQRYSGTGDLGGMLYWTYQGYPSTRIQDVKTHLAAVPNLRVYVIAFGQQLGEQGKRDLQGLAEQSRGQYFFGSDSSTLGQLFNSVAREFITMQTLGIETPLQDGKYEFSLRTKHIASGAEGSRNFSLNVSEASLGACTTP